MSFNIGDGSGHMLEVKRIGNGIRFKMTGDGSDGIEITFDRYQIDRIFEFIKGVMK